MNLNEKNNRHSESNSEKKSQKNPIKNLHKAILFSGISVLFIFIAKLFIFSTDETEVDNDYHNSFKQNYKIFALNVPETIEFATEKVPLSRFDVKESFDQELLVNTYWQSNTLLNIKRAHRWFPVIEPILEKHGVPDDFKYLALIESGFKNVVSPAGAAGYWQFLKTSGKEYGLEITNEVDERYNVEKSTEAACAYLKDAKRKLGSWTLAAAAYNCGVMGVKRQIERQKVTSYYDLLLNDETARYVFRIVAAKEILNNPSKYGFQYRKKDLYERIETYEVEVDSSISNLALFAVSQNTNYKLLKTLNPWLRENNLPQRTGKKYTLKLPKENYKISYLVDEEFVDSISSLSTDSI